MLNIPSTIKALYLTEGRPDIRKNFRVSFPNGEYSDINGDQILSESVKFTESIMSQSSFRFGLAEAPQIQFEVIGAGNMLGMTIDCYHEIETTSLSAAEIASIQAGTWDGELVLEADSDLGFGFFRIPLGEFFVDKCPRNHGAMTHRRVVAYGPDLGKETSLSPFYQFVAKQLYTGDKWRLYPDFYYANLYNNDRGVLNKFAHTSRSYSTSSQPTPVMYISLAGGGTLQLSSTVKAHGSVTYFTLPQANSGMTLVRIIGLKTAAAAARASLRTYLENNNLTLAGATYSGTTFATNEDGIDAIIRAAFGDAYIGFRQGIAATQWPLAYQERYIIRPTSDFIQVLVADTPMYLAAISAMMVPASGSLTARYNATDTTVIPADTPLVGTLEVYDLTTPTGASVIPDMGLSTSGIEVSGLYQYSQVLDYMSVITGLVELNAEFGAIGRDGAFKLVSLDSSSPVSLTPDQYAECWYDEYEVSPIGAVNYRLIDGEEVTSYIGSGLSVYDMTGNALIDMASGIDAVEAMLASNFAPGATALDFIPVELDSRGLPWVEAGDAILITTEDGETVESFVLERTLAGINYLTDDIRATGGDLIGTSVTGY